MRHDSRIFVAGHRGLVGSALVRRLRKLGVDNLVLRSSGELDLRDSVATRRLFETERPQIVVLAAARVGGILANATQPARFIHDNLAIQTNVIQQAWRCNVERLLFLGSSCIYPRDCPQPIREEYLLGGPLEETNRAYAIAKIAGIEMCRSYNVEYGTRFLAIMPSNLYGPGDNYDLRNSHVLPALIRKFHEAKASGAPTVTVWGSGRPRREFLYSDDLADACVFLLGLDDDRFDELLHPGAPRHGNRDGEIPHDASVPLINVGVGRDVTIAELVEKVRDAVGYTGSVEWDRSKPDGTPRKLLDVSRMSALGWTSRTTLDEGIALACADFRDSVASAVAGG
jgi:GDP-L-fucose synthase